MSELKPKPQIQGKQTPPSSNTINSNNKISENHQETQDLIGWQPYHFDHIAQNLILNYRDQKDVLNETHKMRMTVSYGLERFWGEHLRLKRENIQKSNYWKQVWNELATILTKAGVTLPNDTINNVDQQTQQIREMANKIWRMPPDHQRIALMVLTQFCDSLVWWCQRYKKPKDS